VIAELARPVQHTYRDGYGRPEHDRPFHIVECARCAVVLNSGHHYSAEHLHHALALAEEHNRLEHEVEPCQDCQAPIEWDEDRQTYRHHGPACYLSSTSGWIVP
jgi:hypothetical protein